MAFDDLTPNQIQMLTQLIEALNSGNYSDEFIIGRRVGQQRGFIRLYGKSDISDQEIEGFTDSDVQALKDEGYVTTISRGRASLKAKAFQQYKLLKDPLDLFHSTEEMQNMLKQESSLDIFISHSSKDKNIAEALIDLLRAALSIPAERIRCTSVEGYKLKGGASTDETLRREVYDSTVFIGLITEASLHSAYVLFELGARWGAGRHLLPVLASGISSSVLRGPLTGINALRLDVTADIHQMVDDIAEELSKAKSSPSAYQKSLDHLVAVQLKEPPKIEQGEKPLSFNAGSEKGRNADRALLNELRKTLPSTGSIRFIKDYGVNTMPFDLSKLDDFGKFLTEWRDVEHEFIDKELEEKRKHLYVLIDEYMNLVHMNTFSDDGDLRLIPREWKVEQRDRLHQVLRDLAAKETEVVELHQDLIRTARNKLEA